MLWRTRTVREWARVDLVSHSASRDLTRVFFKSIAKTSAGFITAKLEFCLRLAPAFLLAYDIAELAPLRFVCSRLWFAEPGRRVGLFRLRTMREPGLESVSFCER